MADNVIKQGFLRKAFAAENRLSGLWDRIDPVKWFIFLVRSGTPYLEYYDKEDDVFTGDPINSFSLNGCQAVTYNLGRNTRNNFCLVLHDRVLELGCPSREVMLDWCRTLERCLRQLGVLHTERGDHVYTVCPAVVFHGRQKEDAAGACEGASEGDAQPHFHSSQREADFGGGEIDASVQLRNMVRAVPKFGDAETFDEEVDGDYADCVFGLSAPAAVAPLTSPGAGGDTDQSDTSGDFVDESFFLRYKKKSSRLKPAPVGASIAEEESSESGHDSFASSSKAESLVTTSPAQRPIPAPRRKLPRSSVNESPMKTEDSNNNDCFPDPPPPCERKEEGYLIMQTQASCKKSSTSALNDIPQYVMADAGFGSTAIASSRETFRKGLLSMDLTAVPQENRDQFNNENTSSKQPVSAGNAVENNYAPLPGQEEQTSSVEKTSAVQGDDSTDLDLTNHYVAFPIRASESVLSNSSPSPPTLIPRQAPDTNNLNKSLMPPTVVSRQNQNGSSSPREPSPVKSDPTSQESVCPVPLIPPPALSVRNRQENISSTPSIPPARILGQTQLTDIDSAPHLPPPRPPPLRHSAYGILESASLSGLEEVTDPATHTTQRKFVSNYSLEEDDSTLEMDGAGMDDRTLLLRSKYCDGDDDNHGYDDSPPPLPPSLPPRLDSLPNHPANNLSPDFLRVQPPSRQAEAGAGLWPSEHLGKDGAADETNPHSANPALSLLDGKNAAADETNPNLLELHSKNLAADETNPNVPPPLPPRPSGMLSPTSAPPPLPPLRSRSVVVRPQRMQVVSDKAANSAMSHRQPRVGSDGYLVQSSRQLSAKMKLDRSNTVHAVVSLKQSQVEVLQEQKAMAGLVHQLASTAAANGLALVDICSSVWVAGWNQREYPSLHGKFHVGDQLVSINKDPVENSQTAAKMLRRPGKVEVVVRRIPHGEVFAIKRSAEGERIGIKREGGTAEILYVDPHGLAAVHGLPQKAPMVLGSGHCNWVLTEINSRPLNLFFKDSEIEHRLYAVGREISIVVQPSDFIFDLKKKIKKLKNYKSFLVQ